MSFTIFHLNLDLYRELRKSATETSDIEIRDLIIDLQEVRDAEEGIPLAKRLWELNSQRTQRENKPLLEIATTEIDSDDPEEAYKQSQNLDSTWIEGGAVIPHPKTQELLKEKMISGNDFQKEFLRGPVVGVRSTSVGDIVRDNNTNRLYLVLPVGFAVI